MTQAQDINVLIVDDDKDLLETITTTFKLFNFKVVGLSSGNAAIAYLQEKKPVDIIISDIRMPDGDGMKLLNYVKEQNLNQPKLLFISGFSDYSLQEMYDFGADGFFAKPFNASSVRDAVKRCLVAPVERWSAEPVGSLKTKIQKNFESIGAAQKKKTLLPGRGGIFVGLGGNLPRVGSLIGFEFNFKDSVPCKSLQGIGRVKWVGNEDDEIEGIGLEIEFLAEECREAYFNWLFGQSILAFIPKP